MKKILFTIIGLMIIGIATNATEKTKEEAASSKAVQGSIICGKVLDQTTGEELVGVAVKIKGTNKACYTDFEGKYTFSNLEEGEYKIELDIISYSKVETKKIGIGNNEAHSIDFKMNRLN